MDPKRIFRIQILIIFVSIFINPRAYSEPSDTPAFFLLTPNEAQKLRFSAQEWSHIKENLLFGLTSEESIPDGPFIIIQSPRVLNNSDTQTISCTSPLDLKVIFQKNKAPIDMKSLEVTAKKGVFSKSLTERLMPFFHQNIISAKNIEIPPGRYCVVISIADLNGATTVRTYGLHVTR